MSMEQDIALAPLVLPLNAAEATLEQVGGKGASLARMVAAGLPVPPGFHITTAAYRRFVSANDLQKGILAAVATARSDDLATLEEAAKQIGKLFADGTMPDEIAEAIRKAYTELGDGQLAVAVRSSATAEDLPEMSFAGQQETYLNMRGETMVLDAVKCCWASLWTARAIGYRARQGIAPEEVSLAVVVQELVPADAAGILFTANPMTGARDEVMINAAWGLGEAIVGGLVTPDTVVVEKASGTITTQEITDKEVMTVRTAEGTHEEAVSANRRKAAVLSPAQAAELARIGVQIEQLYGQPMDIEWAIRENQVFVVQARPITTLPARATARVAPTIEWKTPNPKGSYMRASVIELLPDPLSPLFATLGLPAWNKAMEEFAEQIMGIGWMDLGESLITINGYGYFGYSLTGGQGARFLLWLLTGMGKMTRLLRSARKRWEEEARPAYAEVVKRWEAIEDEGGGKLTPLLTTHTISAVQLLDGVHEITNVAARHYLAIQGGILPAAYISEMLFTVAYDRFFKRRGDPPALTFMLGYDSSPLRAEQGLYNLAQWAREQEGLAAVLIQMSREQFTVAYQTGRLAGIDESVWSEFQQRLSAHLARFGHTIYDLDFAKSVLAEDPSALLETLKFFLSGEAPDPRARQASTAAAREEAMQAKLSKWRGPFRGQFQKLVQRAQRFAPLREDALADVGLGWPVLRRMLREIGQRLVAAKAIDNPDNIFWLELDELQGAVKAIDSQEPGWGQGNQGGGKDAINRVPTPLLTSHNEHALDSQEPIGDFHAVVSERRAVWENERGVTPPVALPIKGGARFMGIDFTNMMPARASQEAGNVLKGIGASPGQVTATARVIQGPDEFNQMRRGDILVARITTPAWTPLFALASGVVTDVGGPLSHSSIVAREYRIPAVLGTGSATERIHSDQQVTVDGDKGTVTIL